MVPKRSEKGDLGPREHVETNADAVAALLGESKEVVVVPGSALGAVDPRADGAWNDLSRRRRRQPPLQQHGVQLRDLDRRAGGQGRDRGDRVPACPAATAVSPAQVASGLHKRSTALRAALPRGRPGGSVVNGVCPVRRLLLDCIVCIAGGRSPTCRGCAPWRVMQG